MQRKILSLLFISCFFASSFAQPQIEEAAQQLEETENTTENTPDERKNGINSSSIVKSINFTGLKKTRNFYIQRRVKKYLNQSVEEIDLHELETALQVEGIFNNINISLQQVSEEEAAVNVSVEEKITLIPLPFVSFSDTGVSGGGVIMDTNAFGVKDMFALGGVFSSSNKSVFFAFQKSPVMNKYPGLAIYGAYNKNKPEYQNLDKEIALKYKSQLFNIGFSINEKLGEHNSFSQSFKYKYADINSVDAYKTTLNVSSINLFTFGLGWGYNVTDWNGWFLSQSGISLSAEEGFIKSDIFKNALNLSGKLSWQKPVKDNIRLYTTGSAYFGLNNHITVYETQSAGSVNILPSSFFTDRIFGAKSGIEYGLVKGKYATLNAYADYQVVYTRDFDNEYKFLHGPNGGLKLYLAKIAFPAISTGLAYNVTKHYYQYTASLGMSF